MSDWRDRVLQFWFGLDPDQWWGGGEELDARCRDQFRDLHAEKRQLPAESFLADPRTALAAVILFDQLPRNMFRGHADQPLSKDEKTFLYMPFQHSESLGDQRRSVALFTALHDDWLLGFARKHHDIIERFGRFPHRNAMLGRAPRPAEIAAGDIKPW